MSDNVPTAVVTGASMGIGRAIALILADEGYNVVCAARTTAKVEETARHVEARGRQALALTVDVGSFDDVRQMVDQTLQRFNAIDVLINNAGGPLAGVLSPSPASQDEFFSIMESFSFARISDENWRKIFTTNFFGVYHCTQAVLPAMLRKDRGLIVNITSKAGKTKTQVVPGMTAYATAKAAIARFTEVLAFELQCMGSSVRVNAVSPGMVAVSYHENLPPEERALFRKPEEIRDVLLMLLHDTSVSGQVFTSETLKTWDQELREGIV